jgi:hypothetical protein
MIHYGVISFMFGKAAAAIGGRRRIERHVCAVMRWGSLDDFSRRATPRCSIRC